MTVTDTFPVRAPSRLDHLRGHWRTLAPFVSRKLRPLERPTTRLWSTTLDESERGPVQLSGALLDCGSRDAVIVVHGLGGSTDSGYMAMALRACERASKTCLLLNARGSDRSGQDLSHAGLVADVEAAIRSTVFDQVEAIDLFGYSLGGQLALRYASAAPHPKLRRVAAIGSPLLLDRSADAFDAPAFSAYRRHVMVSLYEIYTAVYQRRPGGLIPEEARRITRIREWDDRVIAPYFGFAGADDYYAHASCGHYLGELAVDAIYVGAPYDPMVPPSAVLPALTSADGGKHQRLRTIWDLSAGHLGFSEDFDLGHNVPLGVEDQVLAWLARP